MEDLIKHYLSDATAEKCDIPVIAGVTAALPQDPQVTMAYVPFQLDKTSYPPEKALEEGTLFTVLNKPFLGRRLLNE